MEFEDGSTARATSTGSALDAALPVIAALLALIVVVSAAYLGYEVWQTQVSERDATPTSRAIAELHGMVEQSPADAGLRVRLGEALAAAGRYGDAVRELEAAIQLDENHTGAYIVLGIIGMLERQYVAAESNFSKVLELTEGGDFENVKVHRELAFFYLGEAALDTGDYEDAVGYFKAALRMNRASADSYFGLGMALKGIDETQGAIENLEIALAFDPKFTQAHYELGQVHLASDDRINAAVHFAEAARLDPDNSLPLEALTSIGTVEEWETRARTALSEGETESALEAVLVCRVLSPERADLAVLHAEVLEAMGETTVAREVYLEVLEMDPDNEAAVSGAARLDDDGE